MSNKHSTTISNTHHRNNTSTSLRLSHMTPSNLRRTLLTFRYYIDTSPIQPAYKSAVYCRALLQSLLKNSLLLRSTRAAELHLKQRCFISNDDASPFNMHSSPFTLPTQLVTLLITHTLQHSSKSFNLLHHSCFFHPKP